MYDDEEIGEDIMGDIMGDDFEVVGHDEDGDPIIVSGKKKRRRQRRGGGGVVKVNKAKWRNDQLAPGVQAPGTGLLPLPMSGAGGTNVFTATTTSITFQGVMQKPFRGERFLVSVVRTGTSATGRILGQTFVGTDLQQADLAGFDMELIGTPQAFGVRLTMSAAQPGVWIRVPCVLTTPLAGADTIQVQMILLGQIVH